MPGRHISPRRRHYVYRLRCAGFSCSQINKQLRKTFGAMAGVSHGSITRARQQSIEDAQDAREERCSSSKHQKIYKTNHGRGPSPFLFPCSITAGLSLRLLELLYSP